MKILTFILGLAVTAPALAEVSQEISELTSFSYEDGELAYTYLVGGGCEDHYAETDVSIEELMESSPGVYVVKLKLKVTDFSPKEDNCRSLVKVEGKADILETVKQKFSDDNLGTGFIIIRSFETLPLAGPQAGIRT